MATPLQTDYLLRCTQALERAFERLQLAEPNSIDYELYRSACVKEFEIVLEQSGKLLRRWLVPYLPSKRAADQLTFKEVFRTAGKHGLLPAEAIARWLAYRDNRNLTAHDYGAGFAEETLQLLPVFVQDAYALVEALAHPAE